MATRELYNKDNTYGCTGVGDGPRSVVGFGSVDRRSLHCPTG